jgi:hypothetical protein
VYVKSVQRRSEMKKSVVYWAGLIIVGFCAWALFLALWIVMMSSRPLLIGNLSGPVVLIAGASIFSFIGTRMMKEGRET